MNLVPICLPRKHRIKRSACGDDMELGEIYPGLLARRRIETDLETWVCRRSHIAQEIRHGGVAVSITSLPKQQIASEAKRNTNGRTFSYNCLSSHYSHAASSLIFW